MPEKTSDVVKTIWFHYKFALPNNRVKDFDVRLHPDSLEILTQPQPAYPEWARLGHQKCTNCPLDETKHPHCPVAANLSNPVEYFKDCLSYEKADVEISTECRIYKKQAALQYALSSLFGIYMVTSGCPILDKLRPLVRTHLPFASMEETTYRAISMYLLAQYFIQKRGGKPDWDLKHLSKIYEDIQTVNICFHKRIARIHIEDAGLNALCHLTCYARFTNMLLLEQGLNQIEKLFHAYFESDS